MQRAEQIKTWLKDNLKGDPVIWGVVCGLSALSILAVYSASGSLAYRYSVSTENYLFKHSLLVVLGLVCMYYAHKLDYRYYVGISKLALFASVGLLIFAFLSIPNGPAHPCFRLTWVGLVGCAVQEQGELSIWGGRVYRRVH